jgi:DNA invertase Pin-like site-specific DNA recombinase
MVAYYRISRKSQGADGLGMDAQRAAVAAHVEANGCKLIGEYTEIETGKRHDLDNRPALRKALAHAKRSSATLVVAKLDRLLRSTVVLSLLKTSYVRFVACDNPHANELTIDILAAVAANEVRQISIRTSDALQRLKAKGVLLGSHRPECKDNLSSTAAECGREIGAQRVRELANKAHADIAETMIEMRKAGSALASIADELNAEGHTTRRGCAWNAVQVSRVLARYA